VLGLIKQISIGQFRRDISDVGNQISRSGEHVILTSNGKPMAALVSVGDYERLPRAENQAIDIQKWLADSRTLSNKVEKRQGLPVDVDASLVADRKDLERRI